MSSTDIAVVGIACRFPHSKSPNEFWSNLVEGKDCITDFSKEELLRNGESKKRIDNPNYVASRGILEEIDTFDSKFFNLSPKEAEIADPQHRLFLECVYECLMDIGGEWRGSEVGLFAGSSLSTYMLHMIEQGAHKEVDNYQLLIGNDKDFLCTRTSYALDLRGPSVTVQTACSSSLIAVHMAIQSLLAGESNVAIAGGSNIKLPQIAGYDYIPGMIYSESGRCRPFSESSDGTVSGNGVGAVAMKRLEDAVSDGDEIYALIKGSATNNDGNRKAGFTAPSVDGQKSLLEEAALVSNVDPESISFIECHGTGTSLGDLIEFTALKEVYSKNSTSPCYLGSVKSNIGHTDAASGIAGLIKAVLSLKNDMIPPTLGFTDFSSDLEAHTTRFKVNTSKIDFPKEHVKRAAVSSFGIGGSNCHLILEEAPPSNRRTRKAYEETFYDKKHCWYEGFSPSQEEGLEDTESLVKEINEAELVRMTTAAWCKILGHTTISDDQTFYELGGDSFAAILVVDELKGVLREDIDSNILLNDCSLLEFTCYLKEQLTKETASSILSNIIVPLSENESAKQSLFMIHPVGGFVYHYRELSELIIPDFNVYGIQSKQIGRSEMNEISVEEMAECYCSEIKAMDDIDDVYLCGSSFGGMIAFEMARQFKESGTNVKFLGLIDSPSPKSFKSKLETEDKIISYLMKLGYDIDVDFSNDNRTKHEKIEYCLDLLLTSHFKETLGKLDLNVEGLVQALELFQINMKAMHSYSSDGECDQLLYFKASESDSYLPEASERYWMKKANLEFRCEEIPGNHVTIMKNPNVKVLASSLNEALKGALQVNA
ncbi:beta-ketoacyl synthase N-terminal-like domain-containing protein [Vibrio sp. TRT 17S01]|uniref:thioesterase domain-containing protein n=1 Tax=Vibrio sp. TRT 17S01 TaxID=3418505 RepID=UPI003CF5749F